MITGKNTDRAAVARAWLKRRWEALMGAEPAPPVPPPLREIGTPAGTHFVGREREIDACLRGLLRPAGGCLLLIGPAGCGKTSLVEELARRLLAGEGVPGPLRGRRVVTLSVLDLGSGCGTWGVLEQRLRETFDWLERSGDILFVDEIHTIVSWGDNQGLHDVANHLKGLLTRPGIRVIGATTEREAVHLLRDRALSRRFQTVPLRELPSSCLGEALAGWALRQGFEINPALCGRITRLAHRMLPHRPYPDSAFGLLDALIAAVHCHGFPRDDDELLLRLAREQAGIAEEAVARLAALAMRFPRYRPFLERLSAHFTGRDEGPLRFWLREWEVGFTALVRALEPLLGRAVRLHAQQMEWAEILGAAPGLTGYREY